MGDSAARPTRRRLWAWRIAVCLLLGLGTTVAIAWAAAAWYIGGDPVFDISRFEQIGVFASAETGGCANALAARAYLSVAVSGNLMGSRDHDEAFVKAAREAVAEAQGEGTFPPEWGRKVPPAEVLRPVVLWFQDARGWPMRALWGELVEEIGQQSMRCRGGLSLRPRGRSLNPWTDERFLPLRIIPLGFAVDTLLFGTVWYGVLWMPSAIRARLRRRRDACPSCGYSLAGLAAGSACPECGASVSARPSP